MNFNLSTINRPVFFSSSAIIVLLLATTLISPQFADQLFSNVQQSVTTNGGWFYVLTVAIILGFVLMHYVAGLILSVVFQLAHIIGDTETPMPNEEGTMKNSWAIHQLFTTTNFGTKNKFLSWFTGGLNHQVEHHIFPHISHVHYPKISKIIKETAKEFELPYYEYKTMGNALTAHFKHLKHLGINPKLAS